MSRAGQDEPRHHDRSRAEDDLSNRKAAPQYAPGRDVHFTFDPENVLISPRTGDGRPGSVTLRPEMGFEY
ncbi:MAG: hypothetical protein AB1758_24140, partial [Candidatus Eremiobacterota bacterium]